MMPPAKPQLKPAPRNPPPFTEEETASVRRMVIETKAPLREALDIVERCRRRRFTPDVEPPAAGAPPAPPADAPSPEAPASP